MKAVAAIIVVLVIIALIVGGSYVSHRNQMVTLNEAIKSNWAQVDVVLQRRADLIPNLVETVKGFAAHEETVFGDIAKARAQYLNAQTPADKIAGLDSHQTIRAITKSRITLVTATSAPRVTRDSTKMIRGSPAMGRGTRTRL